jgi:arylsulfatase A-like enzyme
LKAVVAGILAAASGAVLLGARDAAAAALPITPGAGVRVRPFAVYGASRDEVVTVTVPATFTASVRVPAGARLLSAVAVPDRIAGKEIAATAAPVRFRVAFESEGRSETLYERTVDIATQATDRRWFDFGRDLAPLAGHEGTLRFEVTPASTDRPSPAAVDGPVAGAARAGTGRATVALWARPAIASCDDAGPSLLLVAVDALRGDRLSAAGYPRPTTPYLDAFAASATRFTHAFAAGPKTIPSIPQILTGTYFFRHRATAGLSALLGPGRFPSNRAVVDNPHVAAWLQGERPGFDTVVAGELDARAITREALRFLSATGRCRTALYLHYLDTHTPYHPPLRYARMFVDPRAATTLGLTFADVTAAWQHRLAAADRQRVADLYDGAIAWTDRQLGRLLRGVARRGLLDRTLVVVTADHGEELWEHGNFFHGQSLYDELLHVPLLVRFPSAGHGRVVEDLVSTVDIVPTIAEVTAIPPRAGTDLPAAPSPGSSASLAAVTSGDGMNLLPLAAGRPGAVDRTRTVFATVSNADPRSPPRQAVRTPSTKLIRNIEDGTIEMYNLLKDPRERRNLGPAAPGSAELLAALDAVRAQLDGRGYQLRVRSTADRPIAYVVTLASTPPLPIVEPDRLSLERWDRLHVHEHSSALSVGGMIDPGDDDQIRMDILAKTGTLQFTLTLDGAPAPPGTLRLGAGATLAGTLVDLADPALVGEPPVIPAAPSPAAATPALQSPSPPAPRGASTDPSLARETSDTLERARAVTVCFWRAAETTAPGTPPALDAATRARLRSLGYAQ